MNYKSIEDDLNFLKLFDCFLIVIGVFYYIVLCCDEFFGWL